MPANAPSSTLKWLPEATDLPGVIANFNAVIDWSIAEPSGIGYFATMYKRATYAIERAVKNGEFQNGDVMTHFAMIFSQRYFHAINAYLETRNDIEPTSVWRTHFVGLEYPDPIVFQHLLTAVDAHINLDLGIAASSVGRGNMDGLRHDFDTVNQVLASQVQAVLDALGDLSPWIERMRSIIGDATEVLAINKLLIVFRDLAWQFAIELAEADHDERLQLIAERDAWATSLGGVYLSPPGPLGWLCDLIATEESRDVAAIITRLNAGSDAPRPTDPRYQRNL